MKKIYSLLVAALTSLTMLAGENDLLWDYTEKAPSANPDNGLYYGSKVDDAAGTNNGLKGVKLNGSGWAYFEKAAVAGKLKLTFANRKAQTAYAVSVYSATKAAGENPVKGEKIADTKDIEFGGSATIELSADVSGVYIERKTSAEGVLSKIEFKEDVARTFVDFKIDFRDNPYTVLLPEGGELPADVSIEGTTYNGGQHGIYGGSITLHVDGPVKFTIGACQYSGTPISVLLGGLVDLTTVDNKDACGETAGHFDQFVTYTYTGGANYLTFKLANNTYVPYFFAEACDVTPCSVLFKDQNGDVLGKVETIEGATLEAIPYTEADLPAIAATDKFRGWFYTNGKKAKAGDVINGNTTIQAKVTPIEKAITGSIQTYDFTNPIFYPEDHETVEVYDGSYYNNHGWLFGQNGWIGVDVAGKAVVVVTLCQYSESGDVMVMDSEQEIAKYAVVKNETPDGTELAAKFNGGATRLYIRWTAKQYIHKVVVYNVNDFPEKNATTGYYEVPSGDAAAFIMALTMAESGDKIFLPNGTYDLGETVLTTISKNNIAIIGQSMTEVRIKNAPDVKNESIDKTATLRIAKNVSGIYLQDLTIENDLDYYKNDNGRAVALWDQGTQTVCKNVRLLSYQDTYYSNLPGAVRYMEDCEIHGTVDFICGDGSVYFKNNLLYCEIRKKDFGGSDALTANNGQASDKGYVFEGCTLMSECPVVSLGRAWNNSPKVAFLNTLVDYSEGEFSFTDGSKIERWTKELMNPNAWPQFGEYNTHLADGTVLTPASNVVTFIDTKSANATQDIQTVLTADETATYTMEYTLGEWAATAANDAKQAVCDLQNIEAEGIYLVEAENGNAMMMTGTQLAEEIFPDDALITVRKANDRGGFGEAVLYNPEATAIEAVSNQQSAVKAEKVMRDGQLIIIRDGMQYNTIGQTIK
jgi:hypothetical protein